ncbi:hypothetical protein AB0A95_31910 [Micromonospora sp. NPDC049230]|uniref:hypothetical protein n=1 Tax=Micromonospora sp. NPDC049230 TaxID=3155502 RepID=UPI0033E4446E
MALPWRWPPPLDESLGSNSSIREETVRRELPLIGNDVTTRVLLLIVAVLTASLIAMSVGWISWANERRAGHAIIAAGAAFGGALGLMIVSYNFVMHQET